MMGANIFHREPLSLIYAPLRSVLNERPPDVQHPRAAVLNSNKFSLSTGAADAPFRNMCCANIDKNNFREAK